MECGTWQLSMFRAEPVMGLAHSPSVARAEDIISAQSQLENFMIVGAKV